MTTKTPARTRKNTANHIADELRSAILQGRYRSGQSLKQDEIAAELAVSKIPVREALVQLHAEGLVEIRPNRSAVVSSLSLEEIEEIYTIRRLLEPHALEQAIPRMTEVDFARCDFLLAQIDNAADLSHWVELNWEFHAALYAPAHMAHLNRIMHDLHNNVARFVASHQIHPDNLAVSQQQHRSLLAACRERDPQTARALLHKHLTYPVTLFAQS